MKYLGYWYTFYRSVLIILNTNVLSILVLYRTYFVLSTGILYLY